MGAGKTLYPGNTDIYFVSSYWNIWNLFQKLCQAAEMSSKCMPDGHILKRISPNMPTSGSQDPYVLHFTVRKDLDMGF